MTAATLLLVIIVGGYLLVSCLKILARVEVVWFMTRSAKLDDFRLWAQERCSEPWNAETVLCQAIDGSWLARELIRAKLQQAKADHCDPELTFGGCRATPCESKGLSKVLLSIADSWASPLNNRLNPVFYALYPVRSKLKELLHALARGQLPLSALEREVHMFPLLNRRFGSLTGEQTTRDYLLSDVVFPIVRDWGVVFGGSYTKAYRDEECPRDTLSSIGAAMGVDPAAPSREHSRRRLLAKLGGGAQTTGHLIGDVLVYGVKHTALGVIRGTVRAHTLVQQGAQKFRRAKLGQAKLRWDLHWTPQSAGGNAIPSAAQI